jgi:hypothetical protein
MRTARLQAEEKLELALDSLKVGNVREYCEEKGVDRSYVYQLQRELKASAKEMWASRKMGRPPKEEPRNSDSERVAELTRQNQELKEQALRWRVQAELGYILADIFEAAGLLDDKRVKKNLRGRLKRYLLQRPSKR